MFQQPATCNAAWGHVDAPLTSEAMRGYRKMLGNKYFSSLRIPKSSMIAEKVMERDQRTVQGNKQFSNTNPGHRSQDL